MVQVSVNREEGETQQQEVQQRLAQPALENTGERTLRRGFRRLCPAHPAQILQKLHSFNS